MEVGTRVIVDMHGVAYDEQNQWMGKYFNKDVIDHYMFGTIKRHADNGKTGIEFDVELLLEIIITPQVIYMVLVEKDIVCT